jgi:tRNA (guanine37-N1)-methyltransferase
MRIAYDVIGNKEKSVAILGYNTKASKKTAKEIMKRHKAVKSVLKKISDREGDFRLYQTKLLLGDKNTEVIHKEHNYFIKVDPQRVYFSPRESTERQRIAEIVKPAERILIMFSGSGPYSIAIAKKHPENQIVNIDINLDAVSYAEKNIRMNRVRNVKNICGDVRKLRNIGKFDRIIMPLVETAKEFLDDAVLHSKKGTIIHLYGLTKNRKTMEDLEEEVHEISDTYNFRYKIVGKQDVLPYAPRVRKVRLDIKIL